MQINAAPFLQDEELSLALREIARVMRETCAMPRAAEAVEEAAKRLDRRQ